MHLYNFNILTSALRGFGLHRPPRVLGPQGALVFAVAFTFLFQGGSASAAPSKLSGKLVLAAASKRPSPPQKSTGYVQRVPHPLVADKPVEDPFPSMFVVLMGGTPDEAGTKPERRPVDLLLLGHRFERLVVPVLVDQMVLLKNVSSKTSNKGLTPRIDAPGHKEVFASPGDAGSPLNPHGERELAVKEPFVPVVLRDREMGHLRTTLVGIPHKYFATPDAEGNFEIADVPAGSWTARVWYDHGWLEGTDTVVEIPAKGTKSIQSKSPRR